ncbi:mediator of RNA polymerase II transcription subunit 20-like [Saccostrea cucullata]|uniref:mediator of RNA polymerase II transcription subunit 20-like n=1 Tax=Saccostrea cuccullata TaxID=36930 RepID=UPI002ED104A7
MGVVCVFACPVPEGKSGQQVVDGLQKQVEMMGASKAGNFLVDCETYQSNPQNVMQSAQQCVVNILHNSEHPASCFAVTESGQILVSDLLFEDLMTKLTMAKAGRESFYSQRKGFKIESRGQRYEIGDFIIKIGSVSMGSNFRGILVEVEYCPCVIMNDCWNMMKELLQSLVGSAADAPPSILKHKPDTVYTPSDTILQYQEHFNNFRKTVPALQPTR